MFHCRVLSSDGFHSTSELPEAGIIEITMSMVHLDRGVTGTMTQNFYLYSTLLSNLPRFHCVRNTSAVSFSPKEAMFSHLTCFLTTKSTFSTCVEFSGTNSSFQRPWCPARYDLQRKLARDKNERDRGELNNVINTFQIVLDSSKSISS